MPNWATLTATAPTRVASTGRATTATPSGFGVNVTLGATFDDPFGAVQAW